VAKFEDSQNDTTMLKTPSFLIMPVQRIPRYILLLRDIHKYTREASADYKLINDAIHHLDGELQRMNQEIDPTLYPRMKKVLDALDTIEGFQGDLLNQDRDLLREGPLHLKKSKKKVKCKVRRKQSYSFLFNDIFVYCSIINSDGNCSQQKYQDLATLDLRQIMSVSPEGQTNIQVMFDSQNSWILSTLATEDRDRWLKLFQRALETLKRNSKV